MAYTGCCWLGSESVMATDVLTLDFGRDGRAVPRVVPVFFRIWKGEGSGRACEHGCRPHAGVSGNHGKAAAKELMGAEFHDFIDKPW